MVLRVERMGEGYGVVLTEATMAALHLVEGAPVEVRVAGAAMGTAEVVYLSNDEAVAAYRATLDQHREAYAELAK